MTVATPVYAQTGNLLDWGINKLTLRRQKITTDTAYIQRPSEAWTVRVLGNISGTTIRIRENAEDFVPYVMTLDGKTRETVTLSVNYMGLSAAVAVNPAALSGRNQSTEINVNSYGNKIGWDVIYEKSNSFKTSMELDDIHLDLGDFWGSERSFTVNGYYVFNHKRFSYPAAFSQSWVQRRSAGSLMLGVSYRNWRLTNEYNEEDDEETAEDDNNITKVKVNYGGVGVGYGYNLVPQRHWLMSLSVLPTFVVWRENKLYTNYGVAGLPYHFPEVNIVGRAAVVYFWANTFYGMTLVWNYSNAGDFGKLSFSHEKWRGRILWGIRF